LRDFLQPKLRVRLNVRFYRTKQQGGKIAEQISSSQSITCAVLLLLAIELCGQQMHKIDWLAHLLRGG
jgi:hypothetical protein